MHTIIISEQFTFNESRKLLHSVEEFSDKNELIVLDFHKCKYIDSSALGTMLIIRDRFKSISLKSLTGTPKRVIEIANFQKLFNIIQ